MYALNTIKTVQAWPVAEKFMPDFKLPSTEGQPVWTSDYHDHDQDHNRLSLILLFLGDYRRENLSSLLSDLSGHYTTIVNECAEVLVVVRGTSDEAAQIKWRGDLPFPVLADEDGQVHRIYGAMTLDGRSASEAVYVAGPLGELYLSSRASDGPPLPTAAGILGSLDFLESRCPECGLEEL